MKIGSEDPWGFDPTHRCRECGAFYAIDTQFPHGRLWSWSGCRFCVMYDHRLQVLEELSKELKNGWYSWAQSEWERTMQEGQQKTSQGQTQSSTISGATIYNSPLQFTIQFEPDDVFKRHKSQEDIKRFEAAVTQFVKNNEDKTLSDSNNIKHSS